jgi:hypothetical protein
MHLKKSTAFGVINAECNKTFNNTTTDLVEWMDRTQTAVNLSHNGPTLTGHKL